MEQWQVRFTSKIVGVFRGSMPDLLLLARRLRARAEQVLARAETMQDEDAREKMRDVAARYKKLAQRIERSADKE